MDPLPLPLDAKVRLPDHVVHRAFAAEVVVLNLQTGRYHGLNTTAGRMLEALIAAGRIERAVDAVAAEFAQPRERVARDVVELCLALRERDLLVVDDGTAG